MRLLQPKAAFRPNEERLTHPRKKKLKCKTSKSTKKCQSAKK